MIRLLNSILNYTPPERHSGNTRTNSLEQYYTLPSVAKDIVDRLKPHLEGRRILEPAGGTGSFIDALESANVDSVYSVDLDPKHASVMRGDFLKLTNDFTGYVCLTNPPFGRAQSLSVRFFNKAASLGCDKIIFLISASFTKPSVVDRLDRNFHLVEQFEAPSTCYFYNLEPMTQGMFKSMVQVWERRDAKRKDTQKISSNFRFVSRDEIVKGFRYSFSIRKYGTNIGEVFSYGETKGLTITARGGAEHNNPATCFFIYSENPLVERAAREIDWSVHKETSGYIPSICMSIVSIEIDKWLEEHRP